MLFLMKMVKFSTSIIGVLKDKGERRSITICHRANTLDVVLRLDGVNLGRAPSFYFTRLDGSVERNTLPCEDS